MSYDKQCSSCGGFCGRGGCKRENVRMNKQREALEKALLALEIAPLDHNSVKSTFFEKRHYAIIALREALAEPEQEPWGWIVWRAMAEPEIERCKPKDGDYVLCDPLYTAPPALKITQKEIGDICNTSCSPIQAVIKMMVKFNIQLADKNSSIQQWIKDEENE